jgi:hypothetical protein
MFTANKGYSLVMWVVVFAIVISATAMFITPVKRGITAKIMHTTDLALWGMWDNDVKEEGGWNHNQIGAIETQTLQNSLNKNLENKGKVRTILNANSNTLSTYSSY